MAAVHEIVLKIDSIVNQFGDQVVHDGVSFAIERGEILGIVGGSGTGKSVLLRTILGLQKPKSGQVWFNDKPLIGNADARRGHLMSQWGVLFQSGALFSSLTVLENIQLPIKEHYALPAKLRRELATLKLKMVGLPEAAGEKFPSQLSGGMVKRVALARALALDPQVVFLDEPTSGLDPISAAEFDQLLRTLQRDIGLTVVMITHDLDSIFMACDRLAVLVDKKVVIDTVDNIVKHPHPWIKKYFHGLRGQANSRS
ncbi:MAG: ATP-binding cassette domain-containing protein [Pseudomonadales bacterium]|nr:ATP-binding cassette domain-containing protein [Pseudomonadales bacterium]